MASKSRVKAKTARKRPQRATSNVFAMFDQSQIQEFKEAFNMIDQNRDGFVDKEDLHDMLASLGNLNHISLPITCWLWIINWLCIHYKLKKLIGAVLQSKIGFCVCLLFWFATKIIFFFLGFYYYYYYYMMSWCNLGTSSDLQSDLIYKNRWSWSQKFYTSLERV